MATQAQTAVVAGCCGITGTAWSLLKLVLPSGKSMSSHHQCGEEERICACIMLFRFLSLLQACDSIHGGDDSSSLLASVRQVSHNEFRAAEDQFEVDLVSEGRNLAAITCPFMKTVAANCIFS